MGIKPFTYSIDNINTYNQSYWCIFVILILTISTRLTVFDFDTYVSYKTNINNTSLLLNIYLVKSSLTKKIKITSAYMLCHGTIQCIYIYIWYLTNRQISKIPFYRTYRFKYNSWQIHIVRGIQHGPYFTWYWLQYESWHIPGS